MCINWHSYEWIFLFLWAESNPWHELCSLPHDFFPVSLFFFDSRDLFLQPFIFNCGESFPPCQVIDQSAHGRFTCFIFCTTSVGGMFWSRLQYLHTGKKKWLHSLHMVMHSNVSGVRALKLVNKEQFPLSLFFSSLCGT